MTTLLLEAVHSKSATQSLGDSQPHDKRRL
jgi:hypothetical protein